MIDVSIGGITIPENDPRALAELSRHPWRICAWPAGGQGAGGPAPCRGALRPRGRGQEEIQDPRRRADRETSAEARCRSEVRSSPPAARSASSRSSGPCSGLWRTGASVGTGATTSTSRSSSQRSSARIRTASTSAPTSVQSPTGLRPRTRGHHIAIEPLPELAVRLEQRHPEIDVHCCALSDTAGTRTFVREVDARAAAFAARTVALPHGRVPGRGPASRRHRPGRYGHRLHQDRRGRSRGRGTTGGAPDHRTVPPGHRLRARGQRGEELRHAPPRDSRAALRGRAGDLRHGWERAVLAGRVRPGLRPPGSRWNFLADRTSMGTS